MFVFRNNQALITLSGFTFEAVEYLLQKFSPVYDAYTPFVNTVGNFVCKVSHASRPHFMRPEDCLGLYLAWSQKHGSLMVLQVLFGTTFTAVAKYL